MYKILDNRGSAILITLALIAMITILAISSVDYSTTDVELSFNQLHEQKAFYAAESGLARALQTIKADADWRTGFASEQMGNTEYNVTVFDSTVRPALFDTVLIRSVGSSQDTRSIIEVHLIKPTTHPLYDHALYAGNIDEYDPDADPQVWIAELSLGGSGDDKDIINGDIFFNGNIDIGDGAQINGSADAGGDITGNSPTGEANSNLDYLKPPDLADMQYETTSDFYISDTSPWDVNGQIDETDPRHIFVREYRSDVSPADNPGFTFDNTNFFLGDPYAGGGYTKVGGLSGGDLGEVAGLADITGISISSNGNNKTYFVDGNIWIEAGGYLSEIIDSPPEGTQITIVAKGNIYFSDGFIYDYQGNDAVAFIAMTDGESYTDQNGNNQYDVGEPILHDDGDGIYQGPREGSGNVLFGDMNKGPVGTIDGFIYADNNFQDMVFNDSDNPLDFTVNGLLSAGNLMQIDRDQSGDHAPMVINYDDRLLIGTVNLPGLPTVNAIGGKWVAIAWNEVFE